jgi:hypothetical protein
MSAVMIVLPIYIKENLVNNGVEEISNIFQIFIKYPVDIVNETVLPLSGFLDPFFVKLGFNNLLQCIQ